MTANFIKTLRKSSTMNQIIAGLLSNAILFGPTFSLAIDTYIYNNKSQINYSDYILTADPNLKIKDAKNIEDAPEQIATQEVVEINVPVNIALKKKPSLTFKSSNTLGLIGKIDATMQDNYYDNYFEVNIPDSLNLASFDVELSYSLFGLKNATQTIKSLNGHLAFGGLVFERTDQWSDVSESIPSIQLKNGKNEFYFNRRIDENYQYQVKDLSLQLYPKVANQSIVLLGKDLINYNGNVHVLGYVSQHNVKEVYVHNDTLQVQNGIFEGLIHDVADSDKKIAVSYVSELGEKISVHFSVNKVNNTKAVFFKTLTKSDNFYEAIEYENNANFHALSVENPNTAKFQISGLEFKDIRSMNTNIHNVTNGPFPAYRLVENKKQDSIPSRISLQYDESKFPVGYSAKDVRAFYYDATQRTWKNLEVDSLDYVNKKVFAFSQGDTDYINGIIKVPEMPETASFMPTSITDLEYGNPAEGVVSIAPPSPNNTGSVNTSFPIKLPAGRNGMMPSLSVNYNSEGGNGWMGIGWDLQLPAITLNTKWGVPRFESANETELYSLNGEELVLQLSDEITYTNPHRTNNIARNLENIPGPFRKFYLRKEGSYLEIERKGNLPTNYFWVVTDKMGNKSYYGGENSLNNNYVIKDGNGNIVHWALFKTEDPYGNHVKYYYDKETISLGTAPNTLNATSFYPSKIEYTLHGSSSNNYYVVDFKRNSYGNNATYNPNFREDVILSGRSGTFQYIRDLLTEIHVSFKQGNSTPTLVRKYRFDYATKAFNKKQLVKVSEFDKGNFLFYSNTIEYHDFNPQDGIFSGTTDWGNDNGMGDTILNLPISSLPGVGSFIPVGSALGSSISFGGSAGLRAGFGFGNAFFRKNLTFGGGANRDTQRQTEIISFVDINGDGLPDKVFDSGAGGLKYRLNTGSSFGTLSDITGISSLSKTISTSTTLFGDIVFFANLSKSWSTSRSYTDGYFTDVNGDGLIDVIRDGGVRFNQFSDFNGLNQNVNFSNNVNTTKNEIVPGILSQEIANDITLPTLDEIKEESPQFDAVKVWEAPYAGIINISGTAVLKQKNPIEAPNVNNFRLTMQKNGSELAFSPQNGQSNPNLLSLSVVNQSFQTNCNNVLVQKGDLIFFRSHNLGYGTGGEVRWEPKIQYFQMAEFSSFFTDENGKEIHKYDAKDDYILTNGNGIDITAASNASVQTQASQVTFAQGVNFTDEILFKVYFTKSYNLNDEEITITVPETLAKYTSENGLVILDSSISFTTPNENYNYTLNFVIESDSNISWGDVSWKPILNLSINGVTSTQIAPVTHRIYNHQFQEFNPRINTLDLDPEFNEDVVIDEDNENDNILKITHTLNSDNNFNFSSLNDIPDDEFPLRIQLVVKSEKESDNIVSVVGKRNIEISRVSNQYLISNSSTSPIYIKRLNLSEISNLYISYYSKIPIIEDFFQDNNGINIKVERLNETDPNAQNHDFQEVLSINRPLFTSKTNFFGQPYRGWGQFLYNGGIQLSRDENGDIIFNGNNPQIENNFGLGPIEMNIFPTADSNGSIDGMPSDPENASVDDISVSNTIVRYTIYEQDNDLGCYINRVINHQTINDENFVVKHLLHPTSGELLTKQGRFGTADLFTEFVDIDDLLSQGGFPGFRQYSESKGKGTSYGAFGFTQSESTADSKVLNQYLDLNGDNYPDLITQNKTQYTNMLGGLDLLKPTGYTTNSSSEDESVGISLIPLSSALSSNSKTNGNKTNVSKGPEFGSSNGSTTDHNLWVDINGDGLLDKVRLQKINTNPENPLGGIYVQLNTGYSFTNSTLAWYESNTFDFDKSSYRNNLNIGFGLPNIPVSEDASWGVGLSLNTSTARKQVSFADVNGDGLPDFIFRYGSSFFYQLNNGKNFSAVASSLNQSEIQKDISFGGNNTAHITVGFPLFSLFGLTIKITATANGTGILGYNQVETTLQDIDGDGYIDLIEKDAGLLEVSNSNLKVKKSKIGKTYLLKKVNTPLGGSWTVEYERNGNTFNLPQNKWVMSEVKTHDGFTNDSANGFGTDITRTTMVYENPKHDRREREFLGFGTVRVKQHDVINGDAVYRYTVTNYHNENVYLKGLEKRTALYEGDGAEGSEGTLLTENLTFYNILNPQAPVVVFNNPNQFQTVPSTLLDKSRLLVVPVEVVSRSYEGSNSLESKQRFVEYDSNGNLLKYQNFGDMSNPSNLTSEGNSYTTHLTYYNGEAGTPNVDNPTGFVKEIRVTSGNVEYRKRTAEYNVKGKIKKIITKLNATQNNSVAMEYDIFGNLNKMELLDLKNATNTQHFIQNINYETTLNTYPSSMNDSFGQSSTVNSYNYWFGTPTLVTDMNGKQMRTQVDNRGRVVEITAPNEMSNSAGNDWTIRMAYEGNFIAIEPGAPNSNVQHWAHTQHKILGVHNNTFRTCTLVDGFGQVIQSKKSMFDDNLGVMQWLVSGKEQKDAFGRITKTWLTTKHNYIVSTTLTQFNSMTQYRIHNTSIPPTEIVYDSRDRVVSVKQPGEDDAATTAYSIENGLFEVLNTNEKGQTMTSYSDVMGRTLRVEQNGEMNTHFYYNVIGEKIRVKNQLDYSTEYKYDMAGRRIEERSPDRGLQTFDYSPAGNLTRRTTSNLLNAQTPSAINYKYDFNRLVEIQYPNAANNVKYTYGNANTPGAAQKNAIGRLFTQEDASGVQAFGYDNLGNLSQHLRSVAVAGKQSYWFYTQWTYDSFGRIREIIYPDTEKVTYLYNLGGDLNRITKEIPGSMPTTIVVDAIKYDDFGSRTEMKFGNNARTNYDYDTRRRMNMVHHTFSNTFNVKNNYTYDALSNITEIKSNTPNNSMPASGQIGGPVEYTFTYDNYNRLATANGKYVGANDLTTPFLKQEYALEMVYDDISHNIISKKQTHLQGNADNLAAAISNPVAQPKTNYKLLYEDYATGTHNTNVPNPASSTDASYGHVQPHAVRTITEVPEEGCCDENDPRTKKTTIEYDANGNQTLVKQIISEPLPGVDPEEITLYKNLWDEEDRLRAVDLNPQETQAHPLAVYTYDAGGQRIVRYVPGRADVFSNANPALHRAIDDVMIYPSPLITAKLIRPKPDDDISQARTDITSYTKHYYIGSQRVSSALGTTFRLGFFPNQANNFFADLTAMEDFRDVANAKVHTATAALSATYSAMNQSIALPNPAVEGVSMTFLFYPELYDAYFYHSDHLGSSNYISNNTGIVSQHTEYLPFGETFVDEHLNSHNTPFKFNAKELDDETGNYYYGARYYNPKWSTWLSVDPLAEDAPDWTPYRYGFHNPLRFTDPTGMSETEDHWEINSKGDAVLIDEIGEEIIVNGKDITEFNFEGNEKAFSQINKFYGSKAGNDSDVIYPYLSFDETGKFIGDNLPKDWKIRKSPAALKAKPKAFTGKGEGIIVSLWDGIVYDLETYRSKSNLINSMAHERKHLLQNLLNYSSFEELEAIVFQMKHKSWRGQTTRQKQEVIGYARQNYDKLKQYYEHTPNGQAWLKYFKDIIGL